MSTNVKWQMHGKTLVFVTGKGKLGLKWPRGFQEVKVPRFHDNGTGWW